jgi:hypothetical protein
VALGARAGDVYLDGHWRLASSFGREMTSSVQTPAMRAGQEASKHFGRKFAAGLAISGALIGAGIVKGTRLAVRGITATTKAASDLNETVTKSKVIFGPAFVAVDKFARGSAKALGLSRQEALANAASFGDMFKQIGFGIQPAAKMSKGMVTLAADLASFHNADITQVLEAQQAGFRGEYDSLQRFIPAINAARVQQVAMAQTGKDSAKELTAQEKAAATYTIMLRDTEDAQGDFLKTSKQNANQQRIAKAQWLDLKAALGQAFLPAQLAVTRAFTEKLLPAGKVFVRELAPGLKAAATAIGTSLAGAVPPAEELAATAKHLGDRLQELGPGLGAKVGAGVGKLFDLLQKLGPELRNTNVQTSDLGPTLRLSGALFGFVADHADELAKHIPLLVAGFLAYKAAQAAANVAQAVHAALLPAQVAGNFALARSNRTLAASMGERTIAATATTVAEGRLTTVTVASGTAAGAAAGKWALLGTAMRGTLLPLAAFGVGMEATSRIQERATGQHERGIATFLRMTGVLSPLADLIPKYSSGLGAAAAAAGGATTAADRHAAALRGERDAINALSDALAGEEHAELDVRQAKLTVASAQQRLTSLTKEGRKGSLDYRQAQLDLRRAQLDLRDKTDAYKAAQQKANAATAGAMTASQRARPPVDALGRAARTGGERAGDARIPWRKLGEDVSRTYREIHNKTANITAKFGWQGLKVFRTPGGALMTAKGRRLPGYGGGDRIPVLAEGGETVVSKEHSRLPFMREAFETAGVPGYRTGGRIPRFKMQGQQGMVNALGAWDLQVDKVLDLASRRFKKLAAKMGGGNAAIKAFIRSTDPLPYIWGGAGPGGYDCSGIVSAVLGKMTGRGGGHGQRYFTTGTIRPGILGLKGGLGGTLQIGVTPSRGHMAGRYGGLGFEAESTRTGIKIGAAASRPESFSRHFHLAKGGRIDDRMVARFAELVGADIGGDQGRLRINGKVLDSGGWLMPGTTVATNRTGRPEPVGFDYHQMAAALAPALADAMVRALQRNPPVVRVDDVRTGLNAYQRRIGQQPVFR